MRYQWDETKRLQNLEKHGLDFVDAIPVLENSPAFFEDNRKDYGEQRCAAFGKNHGRLLVVIFTMRGSDLFRILPVRKANERERRYYEREIDHRNG